MNDTTNNHDKWVKESLNETRLFGNVIDALWLGDMDDYIREAEIYIKEYIPKKAISHFLPHGVVFLKHDYFSQLNKMITEYREIKLARDMVLLGSTNPDYPEKIREGEKHGF